MTSEDYPYLYSSADKASTRAQFYYINGIKIYLILLFLGSAVGFCKPFVLFPIFWYSAILLALGLAMLLIQAFKRFDEVWYNGRAVAESVKTRTFRFIMRAEPYHEDDKSFLQDLKDILNDNKVLSKTLSVDSDFKIVTSEMTRVRQMELKERKEYYLLNRIDDQRGWYAKKAKWNKRQADWWLGVMIIANATAMILSILFAVWGTDYSISIEPLLVIASIALSWAQAKRFRETGNAYSLTVHEISLIREESARVTTEKDFSDFVNDAENAFSREHTQWVARRKS